jgi:hypothetical protein
VRRNDSRMKSHRTRPGAQRRGLVIALAAFVASTMPTCSARGVEPGGGSRFTMEVEAGPVWQSRNDVRIPNNASATRFSMRRLQGSGPWPAGRVYLTWDINPRNRLRALAAPLSVTETGLLPAQTSFAGGSFAAGTPTEATYKFNSWRLTYAYRLHDGPRWTWWIGFTSKIRDAKVELNQNGTSAVKTDVGFVPLLHVNGAYRLTERWQLALDVDALAGGPGRAEDAALKSRFRLGDRWSLSAGYRTVEGGADVDEVYSFAWFHYAVASLSYEF